MSALGYALVAALLYGEAVVGGQPDGQAPASPNRQRHALLVGCTRYARLPSGGFQLYGPANDVVLMRQLLTGRFGFAPDQIVTLAEGAGGEETLPYRANIEREFKRLADRAGPASEVVILLAGHGSQQPNDHTDDPDDPEPDGLDEIFLPSDIGAWDGRQGKVAGAITDDELRRWIEAICRKGASVWVIVDACHSGTMVRGSGEETVRSVPPEVLVPASALEEARRRASETAGATRGGAVEPSLLKLPKTAGAWVALYACQSTELTVEKGLPADSPQRKPYGLLTYTINQVITQAQSPLTYAELAERVNRQYAAWGRTFPTPLAEGTDLDREVLGAGRWPGRSRIVLVPSTQGGLKINAGALHGLTLGTVLAVHAPASQKDAETVLGHVEITGLRALEADVRPCAHAHTPLRKDFPPQSRCEVAFVDYRLRPLRLALAPAESPGEKPRGAGTQVIAESLKRPGALAHPLIRWVDDSKEADWLIRLDAGRAWLVPAAGVPRLGETTRGGPGEPAAPAMFGPAPLDEHLAPWLEERAARIARARNLVAMAAPGGSPAGASAVALDFEMLRFATASAPEGEVVPWDKAGRLMRPGDVVGFRIRNRSAGAVDVTLLYIDSGYGITAFFPRPGMAVDGRLEPGKSLLTPRARVTADTVGMEQMVLIAVRAEVRPVDFTYLAQPTIEAVRSADGPGNRGMASPLGRLLRTAMYGEGNTRGVEVSEIENYAVHCIRWRVVDRPGGTP